MYDTRKIVRWVITISSIMSGIVGIIASMNMIMSEVKKLSYAMEAKEMGPSLEEMRLLQIESSIDSLKLHHVEVDVDSIP